MIITICGSMQFHREMVDARRMLESLGHQVYIPKGIDKEIPIEARKDLTDEEIINAKIEYDFIRDHFKLIAQSEAILILNFNKKGVENYIGGNTFLEMGYAYGNNKKIFLWNPVPKMDYATEMHAMQPIVIDGDLSKIK
jgi:hypothetical protein